MRRAGLVIATVVSAVALAAVAGAQDPLPSLDDPAALSQDNPALLDTDSTPTGKPGDTWFQVAGARFADADDPAEAERSRGITSYSDNLFDVAFRNENRGLIGGASCEGSDPDAESGCTPVVYRFDASPETGEVWTKVALPGAQRPGYVGAIAWIDSARALAVGGTGLYPRREPSYDPACQQGDLEPWGADCDVTGDARAWLYEDGRWCELKVGGGDGSCPALPAGMRGLTAVDFKPDGSGLGFTGGLGQIHRWQAGRFDKRYDNTSPPSDLQQLNRPSTKSSGTLLPQAMRRMFRFRVRAIGFADAEQIHAFAVTSGCCSPHDSADQAQILAFNETQGAGRWYLSSGQRGDLILAKGLLFQSELTVPVDDPDEIAGGSSEAGISLPAAPTTKVGPHQSGGDRIDSLYAVAPGRAECNNCTPPVAVLATTGSRESAVEPRSVATCVTGGVSTSRPQYGGASVSPLGGTTRLHSIDGATPSDTSCNAGPDWAAGELRSRVAAGRGRQGVMLSTDRTERRRPTAYHPLPPPEKAAEQGYKLPDEERVRASFASLEELVPSYTLNSLDMVLDTGQGWAVGDHGAVLRLDPDRAANVVARAEPESPGLTPGRGRPLMARDAYDQLRPALTSEPGQVPPLATRPVEELAEPRMVSMGSPDATHRPASLADTEDVAEIVMSRDGSEGWAVGPSPVFDEAGPAPPSQNYGVMTLYRFDGAKWTRCDAKGVPGQLAPDPPCAGALALRRYLRPPKDEPTPVRLVGAARIPYERDGEPDNDDDFEVLAVGSGYLYPKSRLELPLLMRYKNDRWQLDEGLESALAAVRQNMAAGGLSPVLRDVAFTAPDDGWVLGSVWTARGDAWLLFHWDGEEWSLCGRTAACGSERLPEVAVGGALLGLTAAGDRVYVYGWRKPLPSEGGGETLQGIAAGNAGRYPLILYREPGEDSEWTDGSGEGGDRGGYDPYFGNPSPGEQGKVVSLSVAQRSDGSYTGWAVGRFFAYEAPPDPGAGRTGWGGQHDQGSAGGLEPTAILMRLGGAGDGGSGWGYFSDRGALYDFMSPTLLPSANPRTQTEPQLQVTMPDGAGGPEDAFIAQRMNNNLFGYSAERGQWELVRSGRPPSGDETHGDYQALAPDGQGGFWAAVKNVGESSWSGSGQVYFFHYTTRPHKPVFREVPHPLGGATERLTALTAAPTGAVWAATDQGRLARYDRMTGWEMVPIDGWDPGAVVTRRSEVSALALAQDGSGIAVGRNGRIANLSSTDVRIDPASSARCSDSPPPCGTGYDLRAAAVSPDGSALAAGSGLTVLFRPAGGGFARVASPPGNSGDAITGIAYPGPDRTGLDRAWLVSSAGYVYRGTRTGDSWLWVRENVDENFDTVGKDGLPLRAIAVDAAGHGFAVGDRGTVLERVPGAAVPWRRLRAPGTDDLVSVTLGTHGQGALVGGDGGLILTRAGDTFEIARPADYSRGTGTAGAAATPAVGGLALPPPDSRGAVGPVTGAVVGVALVPGADPGEVEAWAASEARGSGTDRLFHFATDEEDPLVSPDSRAEPLPDAPPRRPGEVAFAAFGNSDCDSRSVCAVRRGSLKRHEVVGDRIVDELRRRFGGSGEQGFALFTGDATFTAGLPASSVHKSDRVGSPGNWNYVTFGEPTTDPYGHPEMAHAPVMQRQWGRMVADRLEDAGVATFGAIGAGDLARPLYHCDTTGCGAVAEEAKTGDNLTWRTTMAARLAPWGGRGDQPFEGLSFERVADADRDATSVPDQSVELDGDGPAPSVDLKASARTHYAVDVKRDGRAVARVVVVDTSLRSLGQSDPIQQPLEQNGQLAWLERMVCIEGSLATESCTRKPDQAAIVVTNTPTYSYGQTNPTEINAADGVRLEQVLMRHKASVVVSGRLNWNARYWATAPGVHEPCPGAAYQETAPAAGQRVCGREETDQVAGQLPVGAPEGSGELTETLGGVETPPAVEDAERLGDSEIDAAGGVLPFVIAAGGGGPLGTGQGEASPSDGYWNGYSVVRVDPSHDPRKLVVEQRPVFDWITMRPPANVLRPGQRMNLRGQGREPVGYGASVYTRFDPIDSAAITHRYDLVLADPERPYVPLEDANGDYVPLPASVATVDRTTGAVRAARGGTARTYAVAILSVGEKAATWPIAFEPRRSFVPQRARVTLPTIPRPARAPVAQQAVRLADPPPPPATPPATPSSPLASQTLQPPAPPQMPSLPGASAPPAPPAPRLQAPPPPPPPPVPPSVPQQPQPLPLALNAKLQPISIVPSVNPPAPPPVNPAPPAGGAARKEAKQRQAAAAKSEDGGGNEAAENGGDLAQGPSDGGERSAFSKNRPDGFSRAASGGRPAPSFSPLAPSEQPSAWARGALYGGGAGLAALALAFAWITFRPRPGAGGRRREPDLPAPAWSRIRR